MLIFITSFILMFRYEYLKHNAFILLRAHLIFLISWFTYSEIVTGDEILIRRTAVSWDFFTLLMLLMDQHRKL